jgi:hypothetical protein
MRGKMNENPIKRKFGYLKGYFHLILRFCQIKFPSRPVYAVFVAPHVTRILNGVNQIESPSKILITDSSNQEYSFSFSKVLLNWPLTTQRSGIFMESDINFSYANSLSELHIQNRTIPTIKSIEKLLASKNQYQDTQTLLLLDGNSFNFDDSDVRRFIFGLRNRGIRVIVEYCDLLESRGDSTILQRVANVVDLAIIHNPRLCSDKLETEKYLLWPSFPMPTEVEKFARKPKENKLLVSGTNYRGRSHYLSTLRKSSLPLRDLTHTKQRPYNTYSLYSDYLNSLGTTTMMFSTGYRNSKESLLTFRVLESIALETLVLYERGSFINEFFDPYTHYIPINNANDLVFKAQYFLNHQHSAASMISKKAKEYYLRNYSANKFWVAVDKKLS